MTSATIRVAGTGQTLGDGPEALIGLKALEAIPVKIPILWLVLITIALATTGLPFGRRR